MVVNSDVATILIPTIDRSNSARSKKENTIFIVWKHYIQIDNEIGVVVKNAFRVTTTFRPIQQPVFSSLIYTYIDTYFQGLPKVFDKSEDFGIFRLEALKSLTKTLSHSSRHCSLIQK